MGIVVRTAPRNALFHSRIIRKQSNGKEGDSLMSVNGFP